MVRDELGVLSAFLTVAEERNLHRARCREIYTSTRRRPRRDWTSAFVS
jgi:hypothetical protein